MSYTVATSQIRSEERRVGKECIPYVVILGNHDCLGTGGDTFRYIFGNPNFTFDAGKTHFVCLNTNAFEYDYSTAIPDFTFIRDDQSCISPHITNTIVAMHAMPHSDQLDRKSVV